MKNKTTFLTLLILSLLNCASLYTDIPLGHKGILWDSANRKKETLEPGRYNIAFSPFKRIDIYDTRWQSYKENHVEVITQDDLHIDVVASIIIRPDPTKIQEIHSEVGSNYYKTIVQSEFRTAIRNILSAYPYIQIAKKSPDIERDITEAVANKVRSKYIQVDDVNIDDINLSREILEKIEEKLKRQQEAEAMKFIKRKAEEEAEISRIQAQKETETELIRAKNEDKIARMRAKREAEEELIKAEARAKSQKLINSTISENYLKLRTLEAHYKAFESPNAKVIYIPVGKNGLPIYISPIEKWLQEDEIKHNR